MDAKSLFEILIREHAGMLMAYLRSALGTCPACDDVFQETMLTAWRRLDDYDRSRPFGPWLRGIAARILLAEHRASLRLGTPCTLQTLELLSTRCEELHQRPGDTYDEKLETLRECLSRLPDHYRQPIDLQYRDNLSGAAVAKALNLSLETVKKRIQRARQQLLECMRRKLSAVESLT